MIEKLTAKQEKMMIEFREYWLKKGLSTDTFDREKTKSAITHLYGKIGKKPPVFIFCDSPLEANLTINIFRMGIPDRILAELGADLREKLGHELGDRLRDKLWLETWEGLGDKLEEKLGHELGDRLGDKLSCRLGADLRRELRNKLVEYNATGLLGSLDAYWIAYYQFMPQIGIAYDARHQELLDVWTALAESSFWWWPYENYCFVSDRPKKLSFNLDSRLHDEHGPAFEFRDGWKGYYLNGVNFPENLYKRVIAGELTMADIQSIENIEQRMQAIKHAKNGVKDFFVSQNGILRDKVVKKDIKNREVNYELWEIPAGGIFGENVFFAFYDDPSSLERKQKREYMKGVPPCETIAEAMAWGMSDDTHVLSPEDWLALVPLAEES